MGRPKGSKNKEINVPFISVENNKELAWGAKINKTNLVATYDTKNITYSGDIKGFNYENILRDKQKYINDIYSLADYFCDKDQIFRGLVKNVYVPFSLAGGWKLQSNNEDVKQKFLDHYNLIGFDNFLRSVFLQFYKYENVYIYLNPDGNLITLPVNKIRISEMLSNNQPVLEMQVRDLKGVASAGTSARQEFIKTNEEKYKGYPAEIQEAIKSGSSEWVQLDPENTFCFQGLKEDWVKYSIPMVASCLEPFSKKALISNYEKAQLSLGMRGFLHVMVGDKDSPIKKIDKEILDANAEVFKNALSGFPLAVTNWMVKAEWKSVDTKTLFDKDKYREVNADILAAGGISGVVVSGDGEQSTSYASAQVSVQTASQRIKQNASTFANLMNKINLRLIEYIKVSDKEIPVFVFNEIDLNKDGSFLNTCFKLWQQGMISNKTLLTEHKFDYDQERILKEKELKDKDSSIFVLPPSFFNQDNSSEGLNDKKAGAPEKPLSKSKQDKNNNQDTPKPSD